MGLFEGHGLASIYQEIFLAFIWIVVFVSLGHFHLLPKIGRKMALSDYLLIFVFVLFIPNSTYAIWEIKHLIFHYKVAVPPNLLSYLVFGGISLFGIITTIGGLRLVVSHYAKSLNERVGYNLFLSLICGLGALLGQLSLNSWDIFNLSKTIQVFRVPFLNSPLIFVTIITSMFIFITNILLDIYYKPSS